MAVKMSEGYSGKSFSHGGKGRPQKNKGMKLKIGHPVDREFLISEPKIQALQIHRRRKMSASIPVIFIELREPCYITPGTEIIDRDRQLLLSPKTDSFPNLCILNNFGRKMGVSVGFCRLPVKE